MKSSTAAHKLAEEFINVLKYNPELTHNEKILSLELRLDKLIEDVEKGCAEAHQRHEDNKVIVSTLAADIQPLSELAVADQARRGVLLN